MNHLSYARGMNADEHILNWIENRITSSCPQDEVEHIIDYLVSDQAPKRLDRATYSQMKSNTEKWVTLLQKKGNSIQEDSSDTEVVLDFKDGFKFVKLIGKAAYEREGSLMSHCVASYFGKDVEIYSLRDMNNKPHCTIEKDIQIKGKGNGSIHPKYVDMLFGFLNT